LKDTTNVLYNLALVHPIDFTEEEGLALGSPFPEASDASQKLLKLRALEKDLEIEEANISNKVPVGEVEAKLTTTIDDLNAQVEGVVETKNQTQQRLAVLEADKRLLAPLTSIQLDLELYSGYDNLTVFAGPVRSDPEPSLSAAVKNFEIFKSKNADFVAVFVAKSEAPEAQRILVQNGYSEIAIPKGRGTPERSKTSARRRVESPTDADKISKPERAPAMILASGTGIVLKAGSYCASRPQNAFAMRQVPTKVGTSKGTRAQLGKPFRGPWTKSRKEMTRRREIGGESASRPIKIGREAHLDVQRVRSSSRPLGQ
jgi:V/A-type H+-transporting ATPase subunit I